MSQLPLPQSRPVTRRPSYKASPVATIAAYVGTGLVSLGLWALIIAAIFGVTSLVA